MDFQGPGFTLRVPSDWIVQAAPAIQAIFVSADKSLVFRPNLVITLRPLEPDVTLAQIVEFSRQSQENDYSGYALEEQGAINVGAIEGVRRAYRWFDQQQNIWIAQMQSMYVYDQVLYTLTATYAPGDKEAVQPVFAQMFDSFLLEHSDT